MKKKGFTLVELLAVLALLAFVAIITVPLMDTILGSSQKKTKDAQIKEIIEATKKYVIQYSEDLIFDENDEYLLSLTDLKHSEFLDDKEYYNAETEEPLNGCIYIKNKVDKYDYSYIYDCTEKNETSSDTCFLFNSGSITGYNYTKSGCTNPTVITFPTSINGIKIRKIADPSSIANDYLLTSATIDFSRAFYLEEISKDAFKRTSGAVIAIKKIDLSNNSNLISLEESSFEGGNQTKIKEIILPDNLSYIGHFALQNNSLEKVTFPQKIERIQEKAFYGNNLERIEIPSYVKTLGSLAFGDNKLLSVTINSKANSSEFALYNNPFGENINFTDEKIIWKQ